jgi:hypothetical protein
MLLLPWDLKELGAVADGGAALSSNVAAWKQGGYFNSGADYTP